MGDRLNQLSPVRVNIPDRMIMVSCGGYHTACLSGKCYSVPPHFLRFFACLIPCPHAKFPSLCFLCLFTERQKRMMFTHGVGAVMDSLAMGTQTTDFSPHW